MDAVLHRVSSPTFVGRADELAALDGALGRAAAGVPAFTFVAGESGVGKSRLVAELEIRARARAGARVFVGHCLELGGAAIPYAPLVDALRPIARELAECGSEIADALPPATRAALAELMPEFGDAGRGAPTASGHQARVFEALLALLERLGRVQPGRARARGPALGRPLDARLPDLPRAQRAHGAALARRDLPLRRAAPPPPAAAAAGRARAHAGRGAPRARALQPRRAARPDLRDPRRAGAATTWPTACSSAARATRSTPRSCSPPPRTAARSCPRRCATCCCTASSGCRRPPRRSCGWPASSARCATRCSPRCRDLDAPELLRGAARGGRQPGARDRRRARRTRSATRSSARPSTATCSRASAARCTRGSPTASTPDPSCCGDVPAPTRRRRCWPATGTPPTTCRARSAARSRPGWPPSACSRSARRSATSSARSSCGTACPTPRSARAATASTCCATPPPPPAYAGAVGARRRARAQGDRRGRRGRRPVRAAFLHERLGDYLRWAGETEEGFAAYDARDGAAARRARARSAPGCSSTGRAGLMLRGQLRARRGEDGAGGAGDGRALGDATIEAPRAEHARPLARRARRRSTRASSCCGARATSPPPTGLPVEHVQAVINLSEVLDLVGPHRGGAGRGRGRHGRRCGRTPSGPPTTRSWSCRGSTS